MDLWLERATVDDLAAIRDHVTAQVAGLGGDDDIAFRLALAADELCSNVLIHGYGGHGPLRIQVDRTNAFRVVITDQAAGFDPSSAVAPDTEASIDERSAGGLGLHLVRTVSDSFEHRRQAGGNEYIVAIGTSKRNG